MSYQLTHTGAQLDEAIDKVLSDYIDTSDADAVEEDVASGKTCYVNGERVIGTSNAVPMAMVIAMRIAL